MAWDFSALRLHVVPDSRTVQVAGSQFYQLPLWFTRDQALAVTSCDSKCPPPGFWCVSVPTWPPLLWGPSMPSLSLSHVL